MKMKNKPDFKVAQVKVVQGWEADDALIERAIQPPYFLTSDDGRVFDLITWSPTVTINDAIRIKMEVIVRVPEKDPNR